MKSEHLMLIPGGNSILLRQMALSSSPVNKLNERDNAHHNVCRPEERLCVHRQAWMHKCTY